MRLRRFASVLVLVSAVGTPAFAQGAPGGTDVLGPLMHGALVFHGNYCGPGNKGVHPAPVDALDAACMRHDACTVDFQLPACSCNRRLARAAARIAADPRAPAGERRDASFTASGAAQLPCR